MMRAAIREAGLPATYEAREIPRARWPAAMADLHAEGVAGANVTVPHKVGALSGAREATGVARAIGAANTLIRVERGWRADNTDGPGFVAWVTELGHEDALGREALLIGAGGAARAVLWALLDAGCPRVRLRNRTRERAESLAARLPPEARARVAIETPGADGPTARAGRAGGGPMGEAPPEGIEGGIVVNCTSLGLRPGDPLPIRPESLTKASCLLDLVYPDPPLVREAERMGIPSHDGIGLLVSQGALSFERWTGFAPDRKAMTTAIREELARRRR
jgi:shikimate dehydrogenase